MDNRRILCLFDVDGTLTKPRQVIESEMLKYLMEEVKQKCVVGLVGGSDLNKIKEQMGQSFSLEDMDYVFAENGLIAYKNGLEVGKQSMLEHLGEDKMQKLINYVLAEFSSIRLPFKRGTFVEFRTGLLNVSPPGRSCTTAERIAFNEYDRQHGIRNELVRKMRIDLEDLHLQFSIGGEISIDIFPRGWDKTFCLKYVESQFETIHFYGDKTNPGENDYEIYQDKRVVGHSVESPQHLRSLLDHLLKQTST